MGGVFKCHYLVPYSTAGTFYILELSFKTYSKYVWLLGNNTIPKNMINCKDDICMHRLAVQYARKQNFI